MFFVSFSSPSEAFCLLSESASELLITSSSADLASSCADVLLSFASESQSLSAAGAVPLTYMASPRFALTVVVSSAALLTLFASGFV